MGYKYNIKIEFLFSITTEQQKRKSLKQKQKKELEKKFIMKLILSILGLFFLSCMIFFSFSASEARSIHRKTTAKSTTTSTTTTTTTNLCANVTCLNEGVCVVLGNMSVCACRDGFVGENCETYYLSLLTTKANQEQTEEVVDEEEQEEEEVEFVEEEDEESLKFDPSPCSGISCPNGNQIDHKKNLVFKT